MKQINKMLKEILRKMDETNQPIGEYFKNHIDFVYELEEEADKLLNFLKKCYFSILIFMMGWCLSINFLTFINLCTKIISE